MKQYSIAYSLGQSEGENLALLLNVDGLACVCTFFGVFPTQPASPFQLSLKPLAQN
jgi:hypothetical protein